MHYVKMVKIEKRLRLYGTSSSPVRQRGTFDCFVGERRFNGIEVFEGHSNSPSEPLRMLAIRCSLDSWELDAAISIAQNAQKRDVRFVLNGETVFTFDVQRVSTEIRAVSEQCDLLRDQEHVGSIRCNGQDRGAIRTFAPGDSAECLLYLYGEDSMLAEVARAVDGGDECTIVTTD